jgi:hypothetical protein
MIEMSWEANENQDPDNRFPYPGRKPTTEGTEDCTLDDAAHDLDCAVWVGMRSVQRDLEGLLGLKDGTLGFAYQREDRGM